MLKKHQLPTVADFGLDIDLDQLRHETTKLAEQFVDVKTANPMLCANHVKLVGQVYDNFEQINLTTPSETLDHTASIKERLRRKEEHLYNVPTPEYTDSYFQKIITQLQAPASRIRITKLAAGKTIPFHVDYDVSYAVRCICPIFSDDNVINLFKRDGKVEAHVLKPGRAYFLNIAYQHAVVNMSDKPRVALMFSLTNHDDLTAHIAS
jgi:hypothetical protein